MNSIGCTYKKGQQLVITVEDNGHKQNQTATVERSYLSNGREVVILRNDHHYLVKDIQPGKSWELCFCGTTIGDVSVAVAA